MGLPSISVIIATRDRPDLLVEATRSVLAQHLLPEELLVVDDGPTKAASRALAALTAESAFPLRLLTGPEAGPAAARNVGLRAARGELVAFLDDDDLWLPEKLALQVQWFVRRSKLGLLGTGCVRTPAPRAVSAVWGQTCPGLRPISLSAMLRANRLVLSSVVAQRECLTAAGRFDESLPLAQDWDLWLRVAAEWEVAELPAPLTIHRLHPDQRSRDQAAMRAMEAEVMRRALARATTPQPLHGVARRRLSWAHYRLGRALLRSGYRGSAMRELKQSLALSPLHPLVWGSLARCALVSRSPARAVRP